ncbi:MAG: hypothetical protein IIA53_06285 [Chloroflexi bacterium]|nr:hypothetical protein [Chloroflexota bacterium]
MSLNGWNATLRAAALVVGASGAGVAGEGGAASREAVDDDAEVRMPLTRSDLPVVMERPNLSPVAT